LAPVIKVVVIDPGWIGTRDETRGLSVPP
jgi:hypothetical protein